MKKIGELTAVESCEMLANITMYVEELFEEPEFLAIINSRIKVSEDMSKEEIEKLANKVGKKNVFKLLQLLLRKKREIIFNILAELKNTTVEEVAKTSLIVLMKDIYFILNDKELIDFFSSFMKSEQKTS